MNCYFILSIRHLLTLESYNSIAKCLYLVDCNCSLIRQSFSVQKSSHQLNFWLLAHDFEDSENHVKVCIIQ